MAEAPLPAPALRLDPPHLDVGLVTGELSAAVDFYTRVAGAEPVEETGECGGGERRVRLRLGGQHVELIAPATAPPRQPGGLYAGTGFRVLGLLVDDLDALCERVRAGGRRVAEGLDLPGRLRIRFVKDADGNMIELIGLPEPAGAALVDRIQLGLTVADAEASRRHYGGVLGLPEQRPVPMRDGMTRYAFDAGGSTIKLWQRPEPLPRLGGAPGDAVGIRCAIAWLRGASDAAAALAARGAHVVPAPALLGEETVACVVDPDGGHLALREAR